MEEIDLHRHDDDGGHVHHPVRLRTLRQRWVRLADEYCAALYNGAEIWETEPMMLAYRAWRNAE